MAGTAEPTWGMGLLPLGPLLIFAPLIVGAVSPIDLSAWSGWLTGAGILVVLLETGRKAGLLLATPEIRPGPINWPGLPAEVQERVRLLHDEFVAAGFVRDQELLIRNAVVQRGKARGVEISVHYRHPIEHELGKVNISFFEEPGTSTFRLLRYTPMVASLTDRNELYLTTSGMSGGIPLPPRIHRVCHPHVRTVAGILARHRARVAGAREAGARFAGRLEPGAAIEFAFHREVTAFLEARGLWKLVPELGGYMPTVRGAVRMMAAGFAPAALRAWFVDMKKLPPFTWEPFGGAANVVTAAAPGEPPAWKEDAPGAPGAGFRPSAWGEVMRRHYEFLVMPRAGLPLLIVLGGAKLWVFSTLAGSAVGGGGSALDPAGHLAALIVDAFLLSSLTAFGLFSIRAGGLFGGRKADVESFTLGPEHLVVRAGLEENRVKWAGGVKVYRVPGGLWLRLPGGRNYLLRWSRQVAGTREQFTEGLAAHGALKGFVRLPATLAAVAASVALLTWGAFAIRHNRFGGPLSAQALFEGAAGLRMVAAADETVMSSRRITEWWTPSNAFMLGLRNPSDQHDACCRVRLLASVGSTLWVDRLTLRGNFIGAIPRADGWIVLTRTAFGGLASRAGLLWSVSAGALATLDPVSATAWVQPGLGGLKLTADGEWRKAEPTMREGEELGEVVYSTTALGGVRFGMRHQGGGAGVLPGALYVHDMTSATVFAEETKMAHGEISVGDLDRWHAERDRIEPSRPHVMAVPVVAAPAPSPVFTGKKKGAKGKKNR